MEMFLRFWPLCVRVGKKRPTISRCRSTGIVQFAPNWTAHKLVKNADYGKGTQLGGTVICTLDLQVFRASVMMRTSVSAFFRTGGILSS